MSSNHCDIVADGAEAMAYALQKNIEQLIKSMATAEQKPSAETSPDPVIEQLVTELHRRSAVGLQKYGKPLSRDDLKLKDWLRHALEETLDNAGYLQAAINSLESGQPPADSEGAAPAPNEHGDVFHHLMALMRGLKVQNPLYWLTKEPKYLYKLGADISSKIDGDL